jgi:signal transduction histidine kinase
VAGEFELLKKIIQVANSNIGFEDRLQGILDLLVRQEAIDKAALFVKSSDKEPLQIQKLSPRDPSWENTAFPATKTPLDTCSQSRRSLLISRLTRKEHKVLLKNPLFKGFVSLIALPVEDDNLSYGVLCLLSHQTLSPSPQEWDLLEMASRELAGIIRNSRIYTESKKRIAELSVVYQVGNVIGSTLELDELLKRTVAITAQVINAKGAALIILDRHSESVKVASEFGFVPDFMKEKIVKDILEKKSSTIFPNHRNPKKVLSPVPASGEGVQSPPSLEIKPASFMCIPLLFKGPYRGRLCVYEKIPLGGQTDFRFGEGDLSVLSTMGNIIASSLENALTFQEMENLAKTNAWMVKNLSTLYQIDSAMMTTSSLKELLRIILDSITLREGLGLNRAMIFLVDESGKTLRAMAASIQKKGPPEAALPPSDPEAAAGSRLSQLLTNHVGSETSRQATLERDIQDIKIPLASQGGVLVQTVLEGKPFLVTDARNDPRTDKNLVKRLGTESFASLPIRAKDKVIGVIVVDNFIDKHPISQEDLRLLSMLAHQAGLAIENARLYAFIEKTNQELKAARERLLESEKLVALGEMAAGMAHEIRNPLVSIGGFVRRLYKKFQGDDQVQTYFEVIINEVERLEKTLNEIMDFSHDPEGKYKEEDINPIITGAMDLIQREVDEAKIVVQKKLGKVPKVYCDERQIRHVFYNLFLNSIQAMPRGGLLTVRTYLQKTPEGSWAVCEVRDSGGGIPPELLHNIFNPFFTTKADGSGLGLPIVHKIITRHYGQVEIDNHPGEGIAFIVKLPLAREAQHHFRKIRFNGEEKDETDSHRG